ncbi:hypothetical protein MMC25_003920 [Agyrium rufum]|nr:hypothetical protein [Agyrium rufum]
MSHRHFHKRQHHHNGDQAPHNGPRGGPGQVFNPLSSLEAVASEIETAIQGDNTDVATVVSIVYQTATPTFSGSIASYIAITNTKPAPLPASSAQSPSSSPPVPSSSSAQPPPQSTTSASPANQPSTTPVVSGSSAATVSQAASTSVVVSSKFSQHTTLLESISTAPVQTENSSNNPTSTSVTSTTSAAAKAATGTSTSDSGTISQQSSSGLSAGAKAGAAIGVLLAVGLIAGLAFFFWRRRKTQEEEELNEKPMYERNPFADSAVAPAPMPEPMPVPVRVPSPEPMQIPAHPSRISTPPQLSLRPASEFAPMFGKRGTGNMLSMAAAGPISEERSPVSETSNPFDDGTAGVTTAATSGPLTDISAGQDQNIPAPLRIRTPSPETTGATVVPGGAAVASASAMTAQRHNAPKALEIKRLGSPKPGYLDTGAPSPAATEFSMTSASAGSVTGAAPAPLNVHRVQLDFKPSMEDELELRAGQLVRLLHEYDDGWALCIRLDRSQQGVAPRTCLSTRPVKPRARNGPPRSGPSTPTGQVGPQFYGPAAQQSRAASPLSERPGRPTMPIAAPHQQRSMSPGPYGGGPPTASPSSIEALRPRSASIGNAAELKKPISPVGLSPMNPANNPIINAPPQRKPVGTPPQAPKES